MHIFKTGLSPKYIINFPTKTDFKYNSKLRYVVDGLKDLRAQIISNDIRSISIPALGAGLGGLKWDDVKAAIEDGLADLDNVEIFVFNPQ